MSLLLNNVRSAVEDGKIFSAVFTKKNGKKRKIVCRYGVKGNGGSLSYDPDEYDLLHVTEMPSNKYKMIDINTLEQIKIKRTVYAILHH